MNKRGAITLFIIIGMVFLILFSLGIYFQNYLTQGVRVTKIQDVPNELKPIYNYVTSCMEQATKEAIIWNSVQGGFKEVRTNQDGGLISMPFTVTNDLGDSTFFNIPFYVYDSESVIPTKDELQKQLSLRIKSFVLDCLDFSNLNYEVTAQPLQLEVNSEMYEDNIIVKMIYPIEVKIGETIKTWSLFETEVQSIYPELYQAAKEYSEYQAANDNLICLSCIRDLTEIYDIVVKTAEVEDYGIVFHESDEEGNFIGLDPVPDHTSQILYFFTKEEYGGDNVTFMFVHFFDIEDEYKEDALDLLPIPKQVTEAGYLYSYQVEAVGNIKGYYDNTELFEIDELTGLIQFTPAETDIGSYIVTIGIVSEDEEMRAEKMMLDVVKSFNEPTIEYIDYQTAYIGDVYSYQVIAGVNSDEELGEITEAEETIFTYYDDTDLFNIDEKTGIIGFIPVEENIGEHTIRITVVDQNGYVGEQEMTLFVEEEAYKELE